MEMNEMTAEECRAFLERASLGRLGCSFENQPYVVPIYFALQQRLHERFLDLRAEGEVDACESQSVRSNVSVRANTQLTDLIAVGLPLSLR